MFTATEWRNWGYYGLICLDGLLPKRYLSHIALLFEAAYLLNGDSLTFLNLQRAEELLTKYVKDFEKLFGIECMTYNIHLIGHLCTTGRNWGPFWVHSAFSFESMNRKIIGNVTSSNGMAWQIYTRFLMDKFIKNAAWDPSISNETKIFLKSELNVKAYSDNENPLEYSDHTFKGLGKARSPSKQELEEIELAGYQCAQLRVFRKAKIDGIEYRCCDFNPKTKFSNSIAFLPSVGFADIVNIVEWESNDITIHGMFTRPVRHDGFALGTTFIHKVCARENIVFVPTDNNISPAFKVDIPRGLYMIKLPNIWETD